MFSWPIRHYSYAPTDFNEAMPTAITTKLINATTTIEFEQRKRLIKENMRIIYFRGAYHVKLFSLANTQWESIAFSMHASINNNHTSMYTYIYI